MEGMWGATSSVSISKVDLGDAEVPHVLIVEDDYAISSLIRTVLTGLGYATACASSGGEGLRRLDEEQFDLLILDVMLGQTTGWDVLKEVNRRGLRDRTRVMILSARRSELDIMQAWNLGVDEYMTKPFDVEVLVETVQRLVLSSPTSLKQRRETEVERSRILAMVEGAFGNDVKSPGS